MAIAMVAGLGILGSRFQVSLRVRLPKNRQALRMLKKLYEDED